MGYAFSQWFWSFAGEILVAVCIGAAAMIWGLLEGVKRWSAAVNGIVVTAAMLLIINQSGWREPPVKVKIHQWLDEVSFSVREMSRDDLEFWFEVTFTVGPGTKHEHENEQKFYVHRPKQSGNGFVVLEAGYDLLGSFPKLKDLPPKELNLLRRQIIKDLMLKGVDLKEKNDIFVMEFKYSIPVTALTQQDFVRGYYHLWQSQLIAAQDVGLVLER